MDAKKRRDNERKFDEWAELPNGGRRYTLNVVGRGNRRAQYIKEVDADETTVRFYQEIYDESGKLVEVHYKYPEDTGHQRIA